MNYNQLAQQLDQAAYSATATNQLSLTNPINLEEAYAIQSISLGRRYIRGEKWVGLKLGFTSKAKMEQMGVHDLIWGRLTDQMNIQDKGKLVFDRFIHPRAEPEIAFLLKETIESPITLDQAVDCLAGVAVAIEVIDSRYQNFKFSLEDVVADNCSSAAFVLGPWQDPSTSVQNLPMELMINGEIVQSGNSNAILGNPLASLVDAIRLGLANGEVLRKGSIILAGAATPAVFLKEGQQVQAKAGHLGSVSFQVV